MRNLFGLFAIALALSAISFAQASHRTEPAGRLHRPPTGYRYARVARRSMANSRRAALAPARRIHRTGLSYTPARSINAGRLRFVPRKPSQPLERCPWTHNTEIRRVMTSAIRQINSDTPETYQTKAIRGGGIEKCSKCIRGHCVYDHNRVTVIVILAPVCKSENCVCGVERHGEQKHCTITGWTKPEWEPYNIEIECDGEKVWPRKAVDVPAKRIYKPKVTYSPRVTTTIATTQAAAVTTTTTTTLNPPTPEEPTPDDFDVSADGPGSSERPIVLWDETTSEATVVHPAPLINGESDRDVEDEGLLQ